MSYVPVQNSQGRRTVSVNLGGLTKTKFSINNVDYLYLGTSLPYVLRLE